MSRRVFDGQLAKELAVDDHQRYERLRDIARGLVGVVREGLLRDGEVRIHGFGTFRLRRSWARTGEGTWRPARNRVVFRPAKALRERVEPAPAPVTLAEPRASREAALAAGPQLPHLAPVPEAPARPTRPSGVGATAASPAPSEGDEGMASREARLAGATVTATRPAGALDALEPVTAATSSEPPSEREPSSREAILAAGPSAAVAGHGSAAGPASARVADRWDRAAGDSGSAPPGARRDDPAHKPNEGSRMGRVGTDADALNEGHGPAPQETPGRPAGGRGSRGFWAAVALVVLLLAVALWLLWPQGQRSPATADPADAAEDGGGETAAQVSAGGTATEATGQGTGATESASEVGGGSEQAGPAGEDAPLPDVAAAGATVGGGLPTAEAEQRPLHGAAAAGATKSPPTRSATAGQADASSTGGTAPSSPEQIEAAGATSAAEADGGGGGFSGAPFFEGREYTVSPGDTLWGLAQRHYVNPYFWPHIWNNNDDIANPDRISVDQLLWLPTLQGDPQNLTAADRRSIAQGYLQLYRFFKETGDGNPGFALVGVRFFDPSVLPERLRGSAAVKPSTALAAAFEARLEARFGAR